MAAERLNLRIRMLGGSVGRLRAHDAALVVAGARDAGRASLDDRPMYFVSSNPHSMVNLLSGTARRREDEVTAGSSAPVPTTCARSWRPSRTAAPTARGRTSSTSPPRDFFEAQPAAMKERRSEEERAVGITHISSRTALRVSAQVIALDTLDPRWLDPRLGDVDAGAARRAARP